MSGERVVWKFPLEVKGEVTVAMPKDATVLCVQVQGEYPCLWCLVDPENEYESRTFVTVGTGHKYEVGFWEGLRYVGTYQLLDGQFLGHVFEREVKA